MKRLKKRTGAQLQDARKEASQRYSRIGWAILREANVKKVSFHTKGLRGRANGPRGFVSCPRPTTRRRLYVLAHECGHVALGHRRRRPAHREEFEAEQYAHDALRRHGVAVPRKETVAAKEYVAYRIDLSIRRHTTKLDREAVEWTRGYHSPATRKALETGAVTLVNMQRR